MKKKKPTFWEFIRKIHGLSAIAYYILSKNEKDALELDYKIRYGAPIDWSDGL